jgi:hypothetical protein
VAVVLFVYKLVKARRILADGGVDLTRLSRDRRPEPDGTDRGTGVSRRPPSSPGRERAR